jgi:negative regulator of sigma E activity
MGTDLSYDDISSMRRDVNLDTHRLIGEEVLDGNIYYVIESIPRDSSYQYSRMVQWINKSNHVSRRAELYDRRGNHVKTLETLELREAQGRLSAVVTRMSTLSAGTSTTIHTESLRYDDPIPEGVFTTRFLETGRP